MDADEEEEAARAQPGYDRKKFGTNREELDALGERTVRRALNAGAYGHAGLPGFEFVSNWLDDTAFAREAASAALRDEREAAMLSEARDANRLASAANLAALAAASAASEANSISRSNRRIAISAIAFSMATAIAVAVIQFMGQKP